MSQEPAAKRIKLSDDGASSATATPATKGLPDYPKSWTIDHVYQWAVEIVKVDPEDAQKLKTQRLPAMYCTEWQRKDWKATTSLDGGPAFKLSEAVIKLFPSKDESPSSSFTFAFGNLCSFSCIVRCSNYWLGRHAVHQWSYFESEWPHQEFPGGSDDWYRMLYGYGFTSA